MPAPSKYRNIHRLNINIEKDMLNEFRDLCWEERKSLSDKINELIVETVEKKVVGSQNPLNISYGIQEEKPSVSQCDIRHWLPRHDAIAMARRMNLSANDYEHLSQTFEIIARKVKTGYLHKD